MSVVAATTKPVLRSDPNWRKRGEVLSGNEERGMPLIPDSAVFQSRLDALPVATYQPGDNVLTAGSRTGQLLILKKGAVSISKDVIEIAKVAESGAVFGEISACSASRIQPTCVRWKVRNFMSQRRLRC